MRISERLEQTKDALIIFFFCNLSACSVLMKEKMFFNGLQVAKPNDIRDKGKVWCGFALSNICMFSDLVLLASIDVNYESYSSCANAVFLSKCWPKSVLFLAHVLEEQNAFCPYFTWSSLIKSVSKKDSRKSWKEKWLPNLLKMVTIIQLLYTSIRACSIGWLNTLKWDQIYMLFNDRFFSLN